MAITEPYTGTKLVDTTEWSLTTNTSYDTGDAQTADGTYQVFLDLSDMVAGDQLQIRIYEKCRTGDTQQICYEAIPVGVQSQKLWASPALILINGWDVTCDTLAGASITVLWSIRQVA